MLWLLGVSSASGVFVATACTDQTPQICDSCTIQDLSLIVGLICVHVPSLIESQMAAPR